MEGKKKLGDAITAADAILRSDCSRTFLPRRRPSSSPCLPMRQRAWAFRKRVLQEMTTAIGPIMDNFDEVLVSRIGFVLVLNRFHAVG